MTLEEAEQLTNDVEPCASCAFILEMISNLAMNVGRGMLHPLVVHHPCPKCGRVWSLRVEPPPAASRSS